MGSPYIFPTGVTVYEPEKCWNGYTLFQCRGRGALLIDMNGREVHCWGGVYGMPNKLLPGGSLMTTLTEPASQSHVDLAQLTWDGECTWKFEKGQRLEDSPFHTDWISTQHHDYARVGSGAMYYSPELDIDLQGNTIILGHKTVTVPEICPREITDDWIYEVDWDGNIVWEWSASEHFEEFGFDDGARYALSQLGGELMPLNDWLHINCLSELGPNKWYDSGDERFHPNNLIADSREANILFIIDKKTGAIVWKVGPDYMNEFAGLGAIIGPHHTHMIPKGLPGAGNILLFDNGGYAGLGYPNELSASGVGRITRDHSRILEFDPVTLEKVWEYVGEEMTTRYKFYSSHISNCQRLPNGNTFICEGVDGRLFEVTKDKETVWEYVSPYGSQGEYIWTLGMNYGYSIYRAYRVPRDWVPADFPEPVRIPKLDIESFRVPGTPDMQPVEDTIVHK